MGIFIVQPNVNIQNEQNAYKKGKGEQQQVSQLQHFATQNSLFKHFDGECVQMALQYRPTSSPFVHLADGAQHVTPSLANMPQESEVSLL